MAPFARASGRWLPALWFVVAWSGPSPLPGVEFSHCFEHDPCAIVLRLDARPGLPSDGCLYLDTGCSRIALDRPCAALLHGDGGTFTSYLAAGAAAMPDLRTSPFQVEGCAVRAGLPATVFDFSHLAEAVGYHLVGILGTPFFAGRIVDIDPDAGAVRILDRLPSDLDLARYDRWPFLALGGVLWVDLRVGDIHRTALIDTGSSDFIDLPLADIVRLEAAHVLTRSPDPRESTIPGGNIQRPRSTGEQLPVAGFHFASAEVVASDRAAVGMDFIRNFRFIIDLQRNVIYLRPNRGYPLYRMPAAPVLGLFRRDGRIVMSVIRNSDAERCGLASGSTLRAIKGQDVERLTFHAMRDLLSGYRQAPLPLDVIDRDGRPQRIILSRSDLSPAPSNPGAPPRPGPSD